MFWVSGDLGYLGYRCWDLGQHSREMVLTGVAEERTGHVRIDVSRADCVAESVFGSCESSDVAVVPSQGGQSD